MKSAKKAKSFDDLKKPSPSNLSLKESTKRHKDFEQLIRAVIDSKLLSKANKKSKNNPVC